MFPVGRRLTAGPDEGHEKLEDHERRIGPRPRGTAQLIEVISTSGLRGRGGAWFPAARKWEAVARSSQNNAVVVVNASEGEPLSAKDRTLITQRPHLVLDGAALAAEALGATDVVIYIARGSSAERTLDRALKERAHRALPDPPLRVVRTAHRYVAGEASAVINRVSGGTSQPMFTLVRAAEKGVDGRPTLVQNAETLAHVATIARFGAAWFRKMGTHGAPGTTLVTLCGNVRHAGVYEINVGARLTDVLDALGGMQSASAGVLIGGYFGSWLPARSLDTVVLDPDHLRKHHGAAFGCGVIAVLPSNGCTLVESTRILGYLAAESAAQCGPCINGLNALGEAMERIATSNTQTDDLDRVKRWIGMVRDRGACHHPDGAVTMLASALAASGDHLTSHLAGKQCAGLDASGFPPPPAPGNRWR